MRWRPADSIAQLWRADGDHHDSFSHTLEQLAAIKVAAAGEAAILLLHPPLSL